MEEFKLEGMKIKLNAYKISFIVCESGDPVGKYKEYFVYREDPKTEDEAVLVMEFLKWATEAFRQDFLITMEIDKEKDVMTRVEKYTLVGRDKND